MQKRVLVKKFARWMIFIFLPLFFSGAARGKSLYVVPDLSGNYLQAYNVKPDGTITFQKSVTIPFFGGGPRGLALDNDSATLFITYKNTNTVGLVDASNLTVLGTVPAPAATNLAGLDMDDGDDILYAVNWLSNDLFAYDWDASTHTLILRPGFPVHLPNCQGAYDIALDDMNGRLYVADVAGGKIRIYIVNSWVETDVLEPTPLPGGMAADFSRRYIYTTGPDAACGYAYFNNTLLSRYDLDTDLETVVDMGHGGIGLAVDDILGHVYVSGGCLDTDLSVWDTSMDPFTQLQTTGPLANPGKMVLGGIGFNPLNLGKDNGLPADGCVPPGGFITFTVFCDNKDNAFDVHNVVLTDNLPAEVIFLSANGGGSYNAVTHTVTWPVGTLTAGAGPVSYELEVRVDPGAIPGLPATNFLTVQSDETGVTTVEEVTQICNAQMICAPNEQGSILVFPLIDNINYSTIVEIANSSQGGVWLQGFMIVHPPANPADFTKTDFLIHLTQKEVFWWNTRTAYNRQDVEGVLTQLPGFNNRKGFMFVWAIDDDTSQREMEWNYLRGDAILYGGTPSLAFQYNAYPHQGYAVAGDRVLNLDGLEYCMAPGEASVEGFAGNYLPSMAGKWVVCSLDIDFINSIQPDFNINLSVWNQNEIQQSRHLDFYQFRQYDLSGDLDLSFNSIFTPKWHFIATATSPMWSIFYQTIGSYGWAGNVWQHPASGLPATVVLPAVPPGKHGLEDQP